MDGTRTTGEGFLVHRDDATVAVEFEPGGDTATLRSLDPDEVRYIHGKVTDTRPHRVRRRIAAALGPSGDTPGVVRVDGTCARDPFALLDHVVRERTAATLVGVVHGDLNHRNVLFCDNRPFLIDYARGRRNMPVLDDLAWLEMNMLRRPLADGLSFGDLVAVQRLLLLGDLVADVLPSGPDGIGALGERLAGLVAHRGRGAVTAIRLLATLRARVRQICAGKDTGRPWWSEYQVALLLAAHRTFKWPDDLQTVAGWRAQVASGCVATEALEAGGPGLGLWDGAELAAAARALLPLLPDEPDPRAAGLLAAVVEGLSAERESDTGLADVLRRARTAVARAVAGPAAHRRRRELDEERGTRTPFIDLSAEVAVSAARGVRRTWSEAAGAVDRVLAEPDALVLGGSGSGRTTLLDEVERRRLAALLETGPASTEGAETAVPGLLPLRLAEDVVGLCGDGQMLEQQVIAALETVAPGADGRQLLAGVRYTSWPTCRAERAPRPWPTRCGSSGAVGRRCRSQRRRPDGNLPPLTTAAPPCVSSAPGRNRRPATSPVDRRSAGWARSTPPSSSTWCCPAPGRSCCARDAVRLCCSHAWPGGPSAPPRGIGRSMNTRCWTPTSPRPGQPGPTRYVVT